MEDSSKEVPRGTPQPTPYSHQRCVGVCVCVCVCVLLCDLSLQFVSASGFQGLSTPVPSMSHSAGSL